jgi:hypothetical protein
LSISRLHSLTGSYTFDTILYYPLETKIRKAVDKTQNESVFIDTKLPYCPDILQFTQKKSSRSEMQACLPAPIVKPFKHGASHLINNRRWAYAIRENGTLPLVVRRLPWAQLSSRLSDSGFLSEDILRNSIQQLSAPTSKQAFLTDNFHKLIIEFKSRNYPTKYFTLNNPKNVFGKQLSVYPVRRYPPLPINIYHGQIQHFPLVEVILDNVLLYIAQPFPKLNPGLSLLFIKQNLSIPTASEWNTLLGAITPVYSVNDLKSFHDKIYHISVGKSLSNTVFMAIPVPSSVIAVELCIDFTTYIAGRFKKRQQFSLAMAENYANKTTHEQQKDIAALNRGICKHLDALWKVRLSSLWHIATHY